MDYCLDTSVYTQAHRTYYSFDIAPNFWVELENLANKQVIISPIAVYSEIIDGKDELALWVRRLKDTLFFEPNDKVNTILRQVADFSNDRYKDEHWIRDFLKGADPWVVAQAKANDLIVVTMEGQKNTEEVDRLTGRLIGEIKIPNMCDHFGVKWITTYEFLRNLKIKL